jgi:hypothetical protein
VTRKRSGAKPAPRRAAAPDSGPAAREARPAPNPDAPITGVASGSLGTAANLDDTQVMRTADLERAAAESAVPAWLTYDPPPLPVVKEDIPDIAREAAREADPEHVPPRERVKPARRARSSVDDGRRTTALAGAAAGALLVLVVGAAILGAMGGFGTSPAGGGPPFADATQAPFATPTAEPKKGKGEGCHGKGNDCKD